MAAAAAAVIDLSGELLALRAHLAQEQWKSELTGVVVQQLPKLKQWAQLQVRSTRTPMTVRPGC